jgi:hypothetical protein
MLKYLFFALFISIASPCFCVANQINNTAIASVSTKSKQKAIKTYSFLKKWTAKKHFPIFGVISIIAGLLGIGLLIIDNAPCRGLLSLIDSILVFLGIGLGITGLIIGEFALWSILGILISPIILVASVLIMEINENENTN